MAEKFKPDDLVVHDHAPGVRGIVLGYYDNGQVMVCWETGYEPYTLHDERTLEEANVLDLLCEGRDSDFKFAPTYSQCKCGRKLGIKKRKPYCNHCQEYYAIRRAPTVPCDHEEDRRLCLYGCSR